MLTGTVRTALYGAYTVGRGALHTSAYSLGRRFSTLQDAYVVQNRQKNAFVAQKT